MKQGANDIALYIGSTKVDAVFLGTTQVYSTGPVPYDARVEYLASNA